MKGKAVLWFISHYTFVLSVISVWLLHFLVGWCFLQSSRACDKELFKESQRLSVTKRSEMVWSPQAVGLKVDLQSWQSPELREMPPLFCLKDSTPQRGWEAKCQWCKMVKPPPDSAGLILRESSGTASSLVLLERFAAVKYVSTEWLWA